MKKICFIDRNIPYSTDLFQSLSENNTSSEFEILYVCPKYIEPQKISKDFTSKVRSIWTNEKYVKEISEFLKEENPNLIHFSFELKTKSTNVFGIQTGATDIISSYTQVHSLHHSKQLEDTWKVGNYIPKIKYINRKNYIR